MHLSFLTHSPTLKLQTPQAQLSVVLDEEDQVVWQNTRFGTSLCGEVQDRTLGESLYIKSWFCSSTDCAEKIAKKIEPKKWKEENRSEF